MFEVTVFLKQSYSGYAKSGLDSPLLFTQEIPNFEEGGIVESSAPLNLEDYFILPQWILSQDVDQVFFFIGV